jgi:hypothetical protein
MLAANDTLPSSQENALTIPATLQHQDGEHFFRVPEPQGKTLWEMQHEMSDSLNRVQIDYATRFPTARGFESDFLGCASIRCTGFGFLAE